MFDDGLEEAKAAEKKEKGKGGGFWWSLSSAVDDGVPASPRWQHRWLVLELVKVAPAGDGDTRSATEIVHREGDGRERGCIRVTADTVSRDRVVDGQSNSKYPAP
ncbi:unnamed protein product [Lactuca virosa]|uniref:Uncharacterized protein n=1 Tax=Lactuca virosa TaxID=75947 RepID=A0AAU9PH93_9ASTR|nr:unnamed protein product [Lactuca virosa]